MFYFHEWDSTQHRNMWWNVFENGQVKSLIFEVDTFRRGTEDATRIMLAIHNHGVGLCGVFTFEVAETKAAQVNGFARLNQHPLQCTIEED